MRIILSLLFILGTLTELRAQSLLWEIDQEPGSYLSIEGFPNSELPKGVDSLAFYYDHETAILGYMVFKLSGAYLLKSFDEEEIWFNWAKGNSYGTYSDGKVQFCSQLPFRATIACDIFNWDGQTFHYEDTEMEDHSAEKVDRAEELRKAGKPCEALDEYNGVEYPFSYFNPDNVFSELLLEGHESALKKYRSKDYRGAADDIHCILEGAWVTYPDDFLEEGKLNDKTLITYEDYVTIMGDYGLFLLRAKRYKESSKINAALIDFAPEVIGPRLQLADALFLLGKKGEASKTYRDYRSRVVEKGKENKIPSRVLDRL